MAEDDDGIHDGRVAIGHGVTGPGAYATVTVSPLLVTLSDDDLVLVAVSPGSSGLEVTENGAEAFLVMLGSQPTATVTVSASESSAAIAIPNATLTFTRSSWNVAQPLTVSALDDGDSDDETATVTFTAAGGDYANAVLQTRTVTVKDDDVASTAVRLSVAPSIVDEDDGSVTITVTGTLNGMTRSGATDIALSVAGVTATAGDDYTFGYSGDFRIRISGGQMSGTKTFTLSPVDDDLYEEAEYLNVTGSHGTLDVAAHDLLIYDNDTRGIVLSRTAVTVTEDDAAGATYTVALTSEPAEGSVTVTPVPDAWTDVLVSPATLTFTADDWDTPKTVTVTGGPDEDGRTDPVAGISHTVAGGEYRGLTVTGRVAVTIVEDDAPALTVSVQAVEVAEGATATWTVGLATRPSAPVTVTPVLPGGAEAEVRPAALTFTADGSWDREQTVTLTALEDDDAVADAAFTVGHTAAGGGYGGVSAPGIAVTVTEDDAAALAVAPATLAVAEGDAAGAAIMVRLASAPTAPVTVTAALENAGVGKMTVEPATRSFTTGNWSVPQSFTVKGLADADGDDVVADVLFTASGGDYAGAAGRAAVTVEDDDKASTEVRLTVAPSGVAEDAGPSGAAVTVTAALDAAPRNAGTLVTVRVGPGTGAGAAGTGDFEAVTAFTFTIPAGATQAEGEFTLVPVDDDVFEGDETLRLSGTVNAAGLTVVGTALVIGEDDVRGIALSTTALTVVEAGAGVRYAVALTTRPSGAVTVHADAPAGTDLRVAPASLEFTALDWNVAQQFTVSAVDDADMTADAVAAIAHRVDGRRLRGGDGLRHGRGDDRGERRPDGGGDPDRARRRRGRQRQLHGGAGGPADAQREGDGEGAGGPWRRHREAGAAHVHAAGLVRGAVLHGRACGRCGRGRRSRGDDRPRDRGPGQGRRLRHGRGGPGDGELQGPGHGGARVRAGGGDDARGLGRDLHGGARDAADGGRDGHALGAAGHRRDGADGGARVHDAELGNAADGDGDRRAGQRPGRRPGDGRPPGGGRRLRDLGGDGRGGGGKGAAGHGRGRRHALDRGAPHAGAGAGGGGRGRDAGDGDGRARRGAAHGRHRGAGHGAGRGRDGRRGGRGLRGGDGVHAHHRGRKARGHGAVHLHARRRRRGGGRRAGRGGRRGRRADGGPGRTRDRG